MQIIENKTEPKTIHIANVIMGECFRLNGFIYMKMNHVSSEGLNPHPSDIYCVDVESGIGRYFPQYTLVTPKNAKILIEE